MLCGSGVAMALCLYTYHTAKLVPLVGIAFAVMVLRHSDKPLRTAKPLLAALAVFLACSIPAARSYWDLPEALGGRAAQAGLWSAVKETGSLLPIWTSLWRTLLIFQYEQGIGWFGVGSDPAFNLLLAFLFLHGLVESVWRWREPRHALLLIWFVIGLLPGALSSEAPRPYRILLATPPLYVWAALPLARLYDAAGARGWGKQCLRGAAVLIVAAVPFLDFNQYFYRTYTSGEFRWYQGAEILEMARTLRSFGKGWTGYIVANNFDTSHESLIFLSRVWGLSLRDVLSIAEAVPVRDESGDGALFMVTREADAAEEALRTFYPQVQPIYRYEPIATSWFFEPWLRRQEKVRPLPWITFFPVPPSLTETRPVLDAG
jgi:hypothetical protein